MRKFIITVVKIIFGGSKMDFAAMVNNNENKKTFQAETKQWKQAFSVKTVDVENRQIRVLASSPDLDRDSERVLPQAFKKRLDIYMSNPVILAGHQHRLDDGTPSVVGKAVNVWIDKDGLWAVIEFAKTPLAEQYWQLYSNGFMKAVSIGFAPLAWRDVDENGKRVRVIEEVELFEISLVAIPANRSALSKSQQNKADWLADKKIIDELKKENPDFDKQSDEFAAALLGCKNVDGEYVETDEFDMCNDESDGSKTVESGKSMTQTLINDNQYSFAREVNPHGDYDVKEYDFIELVMKK
jgi:HK97 family phage prohead protease